MKPLIDFSEDCNKLSRRSPVIRQGLPVIGTVLVHSSPRGSVNILDLLGVFRRWMKHGDMITGEYLLMIPSLICRLVLLIGEMRFKRTMSFLCSDGQISIAWIGGMEETAALNCFFAWFAEKRG